MLRMEETVLKQVPCARFLERLAKDSLLEGFIKYLTVRVADQQEIIADPSKNNRKVYNMITIIDPNNNAKRVYFDVTQFYSRVEDSMPGVPRGGSTPW